MGFYEDLAATAKTLIDDKGRAITLVQLDFDAPDDTKPWRGPANPRENPASTLTLKGAFVSLGNSLGLSKEIQDLIKKHKQTCLIGSTLDLSAYQELIDSKDGRYYKIMGMEELFPGPTRLLTYLVLAQ